MADMTIRYEDAALVKARRRLSTLYRESGDGVNGD